MSTHKHIDRICAVAVILSLLLTLVMVNGEALGIQAAVSALGYEDHLFDISMVHTINIEMDDWESFLSSCQSEEYVACNVTIDGEVYKDVAIRGKGNTSLSTVSSMDSDRYSFKIEFDHYDSTGSYYGLDKLSLNNLIQDNTMMKDYLTYQLMGGFGVAAPLCSYVYITVNGEAWGLYLAVEGVEDSFLQRNYGSSYGELYKPDSMDMGGGRGNGMDFDMDGFQNKFSQESGTADDTATAESTIIPQMPQGGGMMMPGGDQSGILPSEGASGNTVSSSDMQQSADPPATGGTGELPEGFDPSAMGGTGELPENFDPSAMFGGEGMASMDSGNLMGGFGGMGSSDVKLQYIDDDPDSYTNIFENAKTNVTDADQTRLIESLKALREGEDIQSVVDIEQVIRYFVVHNFVVNGDSYTGSMIHNYYLYEEDGKLAMIPWDYNLAFGTFQGSSATSAVNDDIDAPLSVSGTGDRPMIDWIFASEEYTQLYHQYFQEFISQTDIAGLIEAIAALIAPYVQEDPTKFCTYEEFETGVEALKQFCQLRVESVQSQLAGEDTTVDASTLNLSDMGTMNNGGGFGGRGDSEQMPQGGMTMPGMRPSDTASGVSEAETTLPQQEQSTDQNGTQTPEGFGGQMDGSRDSSFAPENFKENMGSDFSAKNFPGSMGSTASGGQNEEALILLGICILVLLAGLLVAFKFKR